MQQKRGRICEEQKGFNGKRQQLTINSGKREKRKRKNLELYFPECCYSLERTGLSKARSLFLSIVNSDFGNRIVAVMKGFH